MPAWNVRSRKPFTLNEVSVTNQQTRLHHEIAPLASLTVIRSHWTHHGTPSERTEVAITGTRTWTIPYLAVTVSPHQYTVVRRYGVQPPVTSAFWAFLIVAAMPDGSGGKHSATFRDSSTISHTATDHRGKVMWSEVGVRVLTRVTRQEMSVLCQKVIGHQISTSVHRNS